MSITYDFSGKTVLVTGSSRGLGAGILEAFAKAKANCIVNYFADAEGQNAKDAAATAASLTQLGAAKVYTLEADVRKFDSVTNLFEQVKTQCGGLDVLVNNAGVLRDKTIKRMALEDWQAVIDTNLGGVFNCAKLGSEVLRDGGRMISIASIAGLVGFPGQANYAAAKAGVIALTRSISKELCKRKITVNAIAPGLIQTPMMAGIKPEMLAQYEQQIPMGRIALPKDIANAVLFLAAEESEYITGQVLPVTGGWLA